MNSRAEGTVLVWRVRRASGHYRVQQAGRTGKGGRRGQATGRSEVQGVARTPPASVHHIAAERGRGQVAAALPVGRSELLAGRWTAAWASWGAPRGGNAAAASPAARSAQGGGHGSSW